MKFQNFSSLILLSALWAPSCMLIKIALKEFHPITIATTRVVIGALFLFITLKVKSLSLPPFGKIWGHFSIMGLCVNSIPACLFAYGEQYTSSIFASIINGTTPIIVLIFSLIFLPKRRVPFKHFFGITLSFIGFLFLLLPSLTENDFKNDAIGIFAISIATICYSGAMIYAYLFLPKLPPLVAPTSQLLTSSFTLLPLNFLLNTPSLSFPTSFSPILSVILLGILGTAIAFILYYHILEKKGAQSLSLVAYLSPCFGIFLSTSILGEKIEWNTYIGGTLILLGVMIVQKRLKKSKKSFFNLQQNAT